MPAVSEAQRKLIFARFGKKYAKRHHFDNKGKLPEYINRTVKHRMKHGR